MIIFFFAIIILEINQYISPDIMKEALMKLQAVVYFPTYVRILHFNCLRLCSVAWLFDLEYSSSTCTCLFFTAFLYLKSMTKKNNHLFRKIPRLYNSNVNIRPWTFSIMYKTIYLSELTSKVDNDACFKQNMHQSQAYCCLTKYPKSRVLVGETCVFSTTKSSVAHTRIIHNSTFLYLKGTPISNVN